MTRPEIEVVFHVIAECCGELLSSEDYNLQSMIHLSTSIDQVFSWGKCLVATIPHRA